MTDKLNDFAKAFRSLADGVDALAWFFNGMQTDNKPEKPSEGDPGTAKHEPKEPKPDLKLIKEESTSKTKSYEQIAKEAGFDNVTVVHQDNGRVEMSMGYLQNAADCGPIPNEMLDDDDLDPENYYALDEPDEEYTPYSECEGPANSMTADAILGVLFYKYRKLEVDWLVKRKAEIDQLFDDMMNVRQLGRIPDPSWIGPVIDRINKQNPNPFTNVPHPRKIRDNPQG